MVGWDYYDKFGPIEEKYIPDRGEGDNMATQAAVCVSKLVYEWYNNGGIYDNTHNLHFVCNEVDCYANWLYTNLGIMSLAAIAYCETEDDYEEVLRKVADEVLNQRLLTKLEKKPLCGTIYKCKGPFRIVYRSYDDDEEYGSYDSKPKTATHHKGLSKTVGSIMLPKGGRIVKKKKTTRRK